MLVSLNVTVIGTGPEVIFGVKLAASGTCTDDIMG
jgi:hypothetical protein